MQEGSLGSVAVNLPFQNILTAPLSMSVDRLELSLVLQRPRNSQGRTPANADELFGDPLTQSVASVAQEFIHEELETPSLRESLMLDRNDAGPGHAGMDDDMSTHVPGSLDPFVEDALQSRAVNTAERDAEILDDVEGVSVLAQVVERLLARLSFKATNITIRIIHEDHSEITLCLGGISYTTEERQESTLEGGTLEIPVGEKRTVRIDGIDVFMRDLIQKEDVYMKRSQETSSASSGSDTGHGSLSTSSQYPPYEDSTDEDEEIDASMTESMISLPPPVSLSRSESGSPSSTIYLSATSIRAHTPPPHSPDARPLTPSASSPIEPVPSPTQSSPIHPPNAHLPDITRPNHATGSQEDGERGSPILQRELKSTRILSFGKDPVLITLTTPPPRIPSTTPAAPLGGSTDSQSLKLGITVGLVTVALQTTHVNAILSMVAFAQPNRSTDPQPSVPTRTQRTKPSSTSSIPILASLHAEGAIRGVQIFVFRVNSLHSPSHATIQGLFSHPTSSIVQAPHVHLHFEGIESSYSPTVDGATSSTGGIRGGIRDLSAFYISSGTQADSWVASPLLIVDHHLPSQYDPSSSFAEAHYTIPVVNWTDHSSRPTPSGRPKRSLWRTKVPPQSALKGATTRADARDEVILEAVSLRLDNPSGGMHVDIAPLHVFADTAMIAWFLGLFEEISLAAVIDDDVYGGEWDDEVLDQAYTGPRPSSGYPVNHPRSPTRTPRAQIIGLPSLDDFDQHEKKRLTDMMLADMEFEKPPLHEVRLSTSHPGICAITAVPHRLDKRL
jgi:autophagy-related protein 2